jgi:Fe/S biogenesis protein NfuA
MAAWFGLKNKKKSKKSSETKNVQSSDERKAQVPENKEEKKLITITDAAQEKLTELITNAPALILGIRVVAEATSPMNPQYGLAFVQEGEDFEDDAVIDFGDFKAYVDADSLPYVKDIRLNFVASGMSGGFRFDKIMSTTQLEGPVAEKLQKILDEQINPSLALHGGNVKLIDVKGSTAYIELGGGCKGCGMVDVTLKQGIEVMIKQNMPEITEILDTTDHASGTNPYYQPSK